MVRSASAVPNFEKEKGKFLLIFPGNFSFGQGAAVAANGNTQVAAGAAGAENDGEQDGKASVLKEEDQDRSVTKTTTTTKKTATLSSSGVAAATTMGRIEGLRTNNPSFRIPFPHLQKSLVFAGKKVATTSKFLALSCSNKKSGTVQCKVRVRLLVFVCVGVSD